MPTIDPTALAHAARQAGNAYVDYIASVRYHRSQLATAFDREEAEAKLRRRKGQTRRAFTAMIEALLELGNHDDALALAIFDDVIRRAALEPDPEPEATPC